MNVSSMNVSHRGVTPNLPSVRSMSADQVDIDSFVAALAGADEVGMGLASRRVDGVPVYDGAMVAQRADGVGAGAEELLIEWANVLLQGEGIIVIEGALAAEVVDEASAVFESILSAEASDGGSRGDHFAVPGANQRIWNVLEKHCLDSPESFARYYAAPAIDLAARSWLGPGYQVTAQVNMVNPGAPAQEPHRDYHLGFMTDHQAANYLSHVHRLSQVLTLQGAVAHTDMPIETGPTFYLPRSQRYELGYLAWRNDDIRAYIAEHRVQLRLAKGDAVFFNPAVFHGAGANHTSDIRRLGNLLQISSPFGRAMERLDRRAMVAALYPVLRSQWQAGHDQAEVRRVVAASAEGYPFPADLDHDQPVDGLAPASDAAVVMQALGDDWPPDRLMSALRPS